MSKTAVATMMAGVALLIPSSIGLLISGVPTILCPFPALTVIPAFLLSVHLWKAAVAVPMLLFFVWHPGLFRGESDVPKRSYGLLVVAVLLSVADFVTSWKWGLQYQGSHHTYGVCAVNVGWVVFLTLAFARGRDKPSSFGFSLFLHWTLFAWLAWYAFPYMGELP
jgi:hypothetical protein